MSVREDVTVLLDVIDEIERATEGEGEAGDVGESDVKVAEAKAEKASSHQTHEVQDYTKQ